jgi:hypothetical protein
MWQMEKRTGYALFIYISRPRQGAGGFHRIFGNQEIEHA